jgi:hypothetical protein
LRRFPYKGALGRAHLPFALPGDLFSVALDGQCVANLGRRREIPEDVFSEAGGALLVGLVYRRAASNPEEIALADVYGSKAGCSTLSEVFGQECTPLVFDESVDQRSLKSVSMKVKARNEANARVVLFSIAPGIVDDPDRARALGTRLSFDGTRSCASVCDRSFSEGELLTCIDDFYRIVAPTASASSASVSAQATAIKDKELCSVMMPSGFGSCAKPDFNAFKTLCYTGKNGSDASYAKCENYQSDTTMKFWRSNCGGMHIPFRWSGIRQKNSKKIRRTVSGRSGMARKTPRQAPPYDPGIYLPGREFAGATPCGVQGSSQPSSWNWRLPDIEVVDASDPEAPELKIKGSVDKDTQVLHIFPRLPATLQCKLGVDPDPTMGCLGVEEDPTTGDGRLVCGCIDIKPTSATCSCPPMNQVEPRYFSCERKDEQGNDDPNYALKHLPCTRTAHCRDNGTCTKQPVLLDLNTVWEAGIQPPAATPCWKDDPIGHPTKQCGYSLFDISSRVDPVSGVGSLYEDIDTNHARNGVCRNNQSVKCSQDSDCPGNKPCRGYRPEAHGKKL